MSTKKSRKREKPQVEEDDKIERDLVDDEPVEKLDDQIDDEVSSKRIKGKRRKTDDIEDAKEDTSEQSEDQGEQEVSKPKSKRIKSSKSDLVEGSDPEIPSKKESNKPKSHGRPEKQSEENGSKAPQHESRPSSTFTMYVCGFPTDVDIKEYVETRTDGVIDVRVACWHDSGKSKGYAHVDYKDQECLAAAIQALNRNQIESRYIKAEQAQVKDKKFAPSPSDDKTRAQARLFVKNLPYDINEARFREFFIKFGPIKAARLAVWNHTQNKKGFGYIEFEKLEDAVSCVKEHRKSPLQFSGRPLQLDYDEGRPREGFKDENGRAWYKTYPKAPAEKEPKKRLVKRGAKPHGSKH